MIHGLLNFEPKAAFLHLGMDWTVQIACVFAPLTYLTGNYGFERKSCGQSSTKRCLRHIGIDRLCSEGPQIFLSQKNSMCRWLHYLSLVMCRCFVLLELYRITGHREKWIRVVLVLLNNLTFIMKLSWGDLLLINYCF